MSIGNSKRQSIALCRLASLKRGSGDFSGAQKDSFEAQRAARLAGNIYLEAHALDAEASCWVVLGSYDHCMSLLGRAIHLLDLCSMAGGPLHKSLRAAQAEAHRCKTEYAEAHNIHLHLLNNSSAEIHYDHAFRLLNTAQIGVEIGLSEHDVEVNLATAATLFQNLKFSTELMFCDTIRATFEVQRGNISAARNLFQRCIPSAWGKHTEAVTYCLEKLGAVQQWAPVDKFTFPSPVTFLAHSVKCKLRLEIHKALQFLGDVFQARGDQETAISLFTVALDGFTRMDVHRSRGECMVRLGDISKLHGDQVKAVTLWEKAKPLFERSSQMTQLACLDEKITGLSHGQAQEFSQETLDNVSKTDASTGLLEQFSGVDSPNTTGIAEI
jgi:tetratricopeptide (TPR) repeat protein